MKILCFATGRLTRDVETITLKSGKTLSKSSIASDYGWGDNKDTIFLDFVAFGKIGEIIAEHHQKGDPIILEGELQLDKWEDKEGNQKERFKLKVEGFQFAVGKKKRDEPKQEPKPEDLAPDFDSPGSVPF